MRSRVSLRKTGCLINFYLFFPECFIDVPIQAFSSIKLETCRRFSEKNMSEGTETRADRIARYKEERRKQLAAQFSSISSVQQSPAKRQTKDTNSSGSEGPRTTRAFRLRAAAAQEIVATTAAQQNKLDGKDVSC